MKALTLKDFREITKDLPEDTQLMYNGYYKGLRLSGYAYNDLRISNICDGTQIVINPANDFDDRHVRKIG